MVNETEGQCPVQTHNLMMLPVLLVW